MPRDEGKKPLVARFDEISLKRQRTAVLTDIRPVMAGMKRNELIHRLFAECCEICETRTNLEVPTSASSLISTGPDAGKGPHGSI
ncbi:hypothetical protein ACWGI9_45305 [Streptomyces sp. NPDC054833]